MLQGGQCCGFERRRGWALGGLVKSLNTRIGLGIRVPGLRENRRLRHNQGRLQWLLRERCESGFLFHLPCMLHLKSHQFITCVSEVASCNWST